MATTLDLMAAGIDMMRLNLERQFPEDTPKRISERLHTWLLERPMDGPGTPVTWDAWLARRQP
jgi:hypothetical protein